MEESPNIAALAAQLADPARARMLLALMGGRALTVSELAQAAGLGKAGASAQATRLQEAGLLAARRQGRHKYLCLAGPHVAQLVEVLMAAAAGMGGAKAPQTGPRDPALRQARLCYNHLAGAMGVQLYRSLSSRGFLGLDGDGLSLTTEGRAFALDFGLAAEDLAPGRAPLCRDCLDWSERQSHLGGRLGRLLLARMEARGWLRRSAGSRALLVTPEGRRGFALAFPAEAAADAAARGPLPA
ncbi:winged helix-turn-helix transcriptional regulator [Rhodobacter sp. SGA-6-6]|uniref:ArsR/SmtB family transcription factor n=1 Tax=Rhodobacter sp. SGA-6-6 TaxID=2710882 RepID=UPI0013EC8117|nr:winged helix-turn-helix domain-containing protein [Rhodobacter sp. SGA-6-6]NGM45247.1 winged helix-turn-helix transcriptional regulator [Rhodobacter sp. SGA-6-6]